MTEYKMMKSYDGCYHVDCVLLESFINKKAAFDRFYQEVQKEYKNTLIFIKTDYCVLTESYGKNKEV